ncbi:hypothetical protein PRIPAC_96845 [Pristionchus pacificus]|uniref:Uncharacterized protein n=1 Tax=Pristionchus pacificus TaxID=54126 RepID=A0A2A6B2E9_PRIPA|nr:hypothetical protein PRIPAC_96845 [Pristionchus pacificus]|eukprot:PDM60039.1 hypothetical protein PRIPAC_49325 [Pristionchus pacificus]
MELGKKEGGWDDTNKRKESLLEDTEEAGNELHRVMVREATVEGELGGRMMGRLGQWNKCIEQVINEAYEILVSTVCVKSIKGNSPVMVKNVIIDRVPICMVAESGDENGTKGVMDNARDTATTTRIIRDYAITTKSKILWVTAYEKSITVRIRKPCLMDRAKLLITTVRQCENMRNLCTAYIHIF